MKTGTLEQTIHDTIQAAGTNGMTVDELSIQLKRSSKTVSGRCSHLAKTKHIRIIGKRPGVSGKLQTVYASNWVMGNLTTLPPTTTTPKPKKLKNHFVIVTDHSGSMASHREGAKNFFNSQIETIRNNKDQENTVTWFAFSENGIYEITEKCFNVPPDCITKLNYYDTYGETPLYDAIMKASQRAMCDGDTEKSFVVVVLTDGMENASKNTTADKLRKFIEDRQATDKWTFVFQVPTGYKAEFCRRSGVYPGNVQEWGNIEVARQEMTKGINAFYASRASGQTASRNWFTTDLSKVTTSDIKNLADITHQVSVRTVDKEMQIKDFVEAHGVSYSSGRGFYEVMKKEKEVQDYKKLLIMDKTTKRVYADGSKGTVRSLLGLPDTGTVALDPGNHAGYTLFAQSMSTNRILPRGTKLVYW